MSSVQSERILKEFYTAKATGLYSLIVQRAYAWHIPNDIDNTNALVVFRVQSGGTLVQGVIRDVDIEVVCYGGGANMKKSEGLSQAVYEAFYDIHLKADGTYNAMIEVVSGMIMNCEEITPGVLGPGEGDDWPAVQTVWRYQLRNK